MWMHEGHVRQAWDHTATLQAQIATLVSQKPVRPAECHPYHRRASVASLPGIAAAKHLFVKEE